SSRRSSKVQIFDSSIHAMVLPYTHCKTDQKPGDKNGRTARNLENNCLGRTAGFLAGLPTVPLTPTAGFPGPPRAEKHGQRRQGREAQRRPKVSTFHSFRLPPLATQNIMQL